MNCPYCNNFFEPGKYNKTACSRSCSTKIFKKRLKEDPQKFSAFQLKVKQNQSKIWQKRKESGNQSVQNKISKTLIERASKMSVSERREVFDTFYTLSEEDREKKLNIMLKALMNLENRKKGYCMSYQGKYKLKNPQKYRGNHQQVYFRSLWEYATFKWLDANKNIVEWSSEEIIIPYINPLDNKVHRYYPDLWIKFNNSKEYIVEIKPRYQTEPPKKRARRSKKSLQESITFVKNKAKWDAAKSYTKKRNIEFVIWTEDTLRKLGIMAKGL